MSSFCGSDNDENDYEIGTREERAAVVKWVRDCAANNGSMMGWSQDPGARALASRDARLFAFIADQIERGAHRMAKATDREGT